MLHTTHRPTVRIADNFELRTKACCNNLGRSDQRPFRSSSNFRDDATLWQRRYRLDKRLKPPYRPGVPRPRRCLPPILNSTGKPATHGGGARGWLESKTGERARCAPMHALEQLADYGFARRDIARVVEERPHTQMAAVGVTGEAKTFAYFALIDMLDRFIGEPASWLEMPIQVESPEWTWSE